MPFDFELSFTGLCAVSVDHPETPKEVDVFLVKTESDNGNGKPSDHDLEARTSKPEHGMRHHRQEHGALGHPHFPLLTYYTKDLTARSDRRRGEVITGPDGQLIGKRSLTGRRIEVIPPAGYQPGVKLIRRPVDANGFAPHRVPRSPAEERWLNWTLSFRHIDRTIRPQGFLLGNLSDDAAACIVKLHHGTLEARNVVRNFNGEYAIWDFRDTETGEFAREDSQALATTIVLRLSGLEAPVRLQGTLGFVELAPSRIADSLETQVVRATISNMPSRELKVLRPQHLEQIFKLLPPESSVDPARRRFPHAADLTDTPGSGLCPPVTGGTP